MNQLRVQVNSISSFCYYHEIYNTSRRRSTLFFCVVPSFLRRLIQIKKIMRLCQGIRSMSKDTFKWRIFDEAELWYQLLWYHHLLACDISLSANTYLNAVLRGYSITSHNHEALTLFLSNTLSFSSYTALNTLNSCDSTITLFFPSMQMVIFPHSRIWAHRIQATPDRRRSGSYIQFLQEKKVPLASFNLSIISTVFLFLFTLICLKHKMILLYLILPEFTKAEQYFVLKATKATNTTKKWLINPQLSELCSGWCNVMSCFPWNFMDAADHSIRLREERGANDVRGYVQRHHICFMRSYRMQALIIEVP